MLVTPGSEKAKMLKHGLFSSLFGDKVHQKKLHLSFGRRSRLKNVSIGCADVKTLKGYALGWTIRKIVGAEGGWGLGNYQAVRTAVRRSC